MNRVIVLAFLTLFVAPMTLVGTASANDRDFTIFNDTDSAIDAMWLSTRDSDTWYAISHFEAIEPGDSSNITFDESGKCQVQLRLHMADGSVHEWPNGFNLCKISRIRIHVDDNGDYQAEFE
jgi:hypothetical protein